ncbi:SMI1/KNR4 family protein [Saccharicrinis sp. FJH54]|uniref:SMI1/KNR4 family protein n=1 Tax=Saccharicrinis sp. FJH54 TaxID=3344665 RepID=UPI0035D47830
MTVDKSNFWAENFYKHPPLTDKTIMSAEFALKVQLPKLLIELLKIQNGGYTKGFRFPMKQKTSWAEDHVPFNEMFGIVTDKSIDTAQNILDSDYMTKEWGLPEKQVLLSGDGHYWISLDFRNNSIPSVRWLDMENNEDIHIANCFDDFINGLVKEDKHTE